jgi:membrane protease YdiL (CAAX protease family)
MLGLARHFSRSLYVPMLMHIIGNLYSIHQSLAR